MSGIALFALLIWSPWDLDDDVPVGQLLIRLVACVLCLGLSTAAAITELARLVGLTA